jgi:hypothetical protein
MKRRMVWVWLLLAATASVPAAQIPTPFQAKQDPKDARPFPETAALEAARAAAEQRPLFTDSNPLALSLVADFGQVQNDRDLFSDKTYPAKIVLAQGASGEQTIPVQIRTRGHSRLKRDFCSFAPLRIVFPENPRGTVFEGQKSLKLGVHCRDVGSYPEYTLREYPVYRMFNLLTANSFRARLAQVRYVEAKNGKTTERGGLFIEDDDDLARRLGGRISDSSGPNEAKLDFGMTALTTIFEYLIGNTDVSIRTLHNIRIVLRPDGSRLPVPYDFDYAGVVDAVYAQPHPLLQIASVRERLYLGPCQPPPLLNLYVSRIRAARESLLGIYDTVPMLSDKYRADAKKYLDDFFRKTADPSGVKKAFIDGCGTRAFM